MVQSAAVRDYLKTASRVGGVANRLTAAAVAMMLSSPDGDKPRLVHTPVMALPRGACSAATINYQLAYWRWYLRDLRSANRHAYLVQAFGTTSQ
jgi:hypothetical protein